MSIGDAKPAPGIVAREAWLFGKPSWPSAPAPTPYTWSITGAGALQGTVSRAQWSLPTRHAHPVGKHVLAMQTDDEVGAVVQLRDVLHLLPVELGAGGPDPEKVADPGLPRRKRHLGHLHPELGQRVGNRCSEHEAGDGVRRLGSCWERRRKPRIAAPLSRPQRTRAHSPALGHLQRSPHGAPAVVSRDVDLDRLFHHGLRLLAGRHGLSNGLSPGAGP